MFKRIYLPLLVMIIPVFGFFLSEWKIKMRAETISENNIINVTIWRSVCETGGEKSYIVFPDKGENHIINLKGVKCDKFQPGDQVEVYYSERHNWYILKGDDGYSANERNGMVISVLWFVFMIGYLIKNIFFYGKQ